MNGSQSILVFTSGIFMVVMYLTVLLKGPRVSPFAKAKFSSKKLPILVQFLVGVAVASVIIGFFFSQSFDVVGLYVLMNLFIGLITGTYLWLFHDEKSDKKVTNA